MLGLLLVGLPVEEHKSFDIFTPSLLGPMMRDPENPRDKAKTREGSTFRDSSILQFF